MITVKSSADLEIMREGGNILKGVFKVVEQNIKEGMSTKQVDKLVYDYIKSCGASAPCIGYCGYPAATCVSIDDMVIHGIPSDDVIIKNGQKKGNNKIAPFLTLNFNPLTLASLLLL